MASLTGSSVATTYDQLLTLPSGGGNTTTLVALTDGGGVNTFCLQLATTKAMIEGNGSTLYFFDEGGESISADNAGVLSIAGGAEIDITTPTVDINASTAVTVDGPSVAISSTSASEPVLHITNTHAGATAGEIRFNKDSASGDDNDVMGTISWYGTDDDDNTHERLAYMDAIITDSAEGSEAASLRFYVAENDATLTQGLALAGQADADGEIDVTIGAGAASTATVAGDLAVTGNIDLEDDKGIIFGSGDDYILGFLDGENDGGWFLGDSIGSGTTEGQVTFHVDSGSNNTNMNLKGGEAGKGILYLWGDQGDDPGDQWRIEGRNGDVMYVVNETNGNVCYFQENGNAYADAVWNDNAFDYAEFFEWKTHLASDGAVKDLYGMSVVLDGNKVRVAESG